MLMDQLSISQMSQTDAEEIASWKYEGTHSFYNAENDQEDLEELLSEDARGNHYFSVKDSNQKLIGFYTFLIHQNEVVIGLGLAPHYTGKGIGLDFVNKGINYIEKNFNNINKVNLSVAEFNERAIKVYKKAKFKTISTYMQRTNGSEYPFIKMERTLKRSNT
jgi:[ribosomal protein S18]-alanine N-acetyltransferase